MINPAPSFKICRLLATVLISGALLGGCQSPMYSGANDMSGSVAEPPYKVGGKPDQADDDADTASEAEPGSSDAEGRQYEYRGGRDPITGKAKTQM